MRSKLFLFIATVLISSSFFALANTEFVTVPAEAIVDVEEGNYAKAREDAIELAFTEAVRMTVAGLVRGDTLQEKIETLNELIIDHAADYVKSYKFLDETTDVVNRQLKMRLQVTLFLSDIRTAINKAGLPTKRRDLPKILVIVDERNEEFFTGENFLLLKSVSEEVLSQSFRDKGYQVADRKNVVKALLGKTTLRAVEGDAGAIKSLNSILGADMMIFGKTVVKANPTAGGELVEAIVSLELVSGVDGKKIMYVQKLDSGIYGDVLAGTLESIQSASREAARSLLLAIPQKWKELRDKRDE